MRNFQTTIWPPVMFGRDASLQTGKKFAEYDVKKILAIYDKGVYDAGIVAPVLESVRAEGIGVVTFDKVVPDPLDIHCVEAAQIANTEAVDGILGIGGGSSLDSAKTVAVYRHYMDRPLSDYYVGTHKGPGLSRREAKLILIPTTSGSGAEMSAGSVITDTARHTKSFFMPLPTTGKADLAILDPSLTLGMPKYITATTGMDAFSHAVETITGRRRSVRSDMIDGQAIAMIWRSLPVAYHNGSDIEARSEMHVAANMALTADGHNHLGHAFATALGGVYHIAHGHCCALMLPEVVRYVAKDAEREIRIMAGHMGLDDKAQDISGLVAREIEGFVKGLELRSLRELGVDGSLLGQVADITMEQKLYLNELDTPISRQQVLDMLLRVYG